MVRHTLIYSVGDRKTRDTSSLLSSTVLFGTIMKRTYHFSYITLSWSIFTFFTTEVPKGETIQSYVNEIQQGPRNNLTQKPTRRSYQASICMVYIYTDIPSTGSQGLGIGSFQNCNFINLGVPTFFVTFETYNWQFLYIPYIYTGIVSSTVPILQYVEKYRRHFNYEYVPRTVATGTGTVVVGTTRNHARYWQEPIIFNFIYASNNKKHIEVFSSIID